ncbi:MAG TPA: MFS transporter [Patescibacteria group bacterium]
MAKAVNRWWVMALVGMAQFIVVLDVTIVNVALPSMQRDLGISAINLQWIITAYTLAFGGFLLLGGRAADILGRKRTFMAGVAAFSIASLLVGIAENESLVILARGVQGLAAAFMSPAALSIILNTFNEGKDRNRALSVWGAITSSGAAVGLLLGGVLTEYFSWRYNFFVNVPIGLLVALAAWRIVPESRADLGHKQFDLFGAATVTGGLMLLVYGLTKAPEYGWGDERTLAMLGGALATLAVFLLNERRSKHPLMPLSIFTTKNVGKSNLVMFPVVASMFAMFFFLTLYIQNVLGYSPVKTGLAFFPVAITIGIVAGIASGLISKIGFKWPMVAGPLFIAGGLFWLGHLPVQGEYLTDVLPPLVLVAAGMGLSFVSVTIGATNGVPAKDSGLASGLLNTTQQVGGALGLAILSAVSASAAKDYLSEKLAALPASGAGATHAGFPNPAAAPDLQTAALVDGFHAAFYVGAALAVLGALFALVFVKHRKGEKIEASIAARA